MSENSIDPNKITVSSIRADRIPAASLAVTKIKGLDIGEAIAELRQGSRVARAGWNGKGMFLELQVPDAHSKMSLPYVFMFTACKNRVPWLCSQSDLLATDWEIVDGAEAAKPADPEPKPLPECLTKLVETEDYGIDANAIRFTGLTMRVDLDTSAATAKIDALVNHARAAERELRATLSSEVAWELSK